MNAPKPSLVALDTSVLLDLAEKSDDAQDCVATIRKRLAGVSLIILPAVIQELALLLENPLPRKRRLAELALASIRDPWRFQPLNFIPVGHGITGAIAAKIRRAGLLPGDEIQDSLIIAEAALAGAVLLVSADNHLLDVDREQLGLLLRASDVGCPIIVSPRRIARGFFR